MTAVSLTGTSGVVSAAPTTPAAAAARPDIGPNVLTVDPSISAGQIQGQMDAISSSQIDHEMVTQRYSLLLKPGIYCTAAAPLKFQVG